MGVRVVGEDDDRALLRDGELLARDGLDGVAEHVRVVEPDVREQHDASAEDVRRVEPAPEPRLDDRRVHARVREGRERGGRDDLELGRADALGCGTDERHRLLEVRLGAVDPDPLAPARHVRRDGRADREPLGEEELLDRDRRRRLPVRAHDVDRGVRLLRVAELGEERAHPLEPEAFAGPGRERVEPAFAAHTFSSLARRFTRRGTAYHRVFW